MRSASRGSGEGPTPDYLKRNRDAWSRIAANYVESGRQAWASAEPCWGIWNIPESTLHVLPDVAGRDVIELGCGTAYVSAWLARRGARVIGIDEWKAEAELLLESPRTRELHG